MAAQERKLLEARDIYLTKIIKALCYCRTLPHLEYLAWEEYDGLSPSFFRAINMSSIRHFKIDRPADTCISDLAMKLSDTILYGWPLRTLYMKWDHEDIEDDIAEDEPSPRLPASLLRKSAATIETLTWSNYRRSAEPTFAADSIPKFPSLRRLRLGRFTPLADVPILKTFLDSKLTSLLILVGECVVVDILKHHGDIPSLQTLSMNNPPIEFLQANTQLSRIQLLYSTGDFTVDFLESEFLPLFSVHFPNLTSLHITWPDECASVPQKSLQIVGQLRNLNQLCMACGEVTGV